jgi:hypothetical protein
MLAERLSRRGRCTARWAALAGAALAFLAMTAPAGADTFQHERGRAPAASPIRLAGPSGSTQFSGETPCLGGLCSSPGEPVLAVGPKDVLQTSNTAATVFSKSGAKLAELDFTSFWGSETQVCGDPRAIYIASVDRFAMSCGDATKSTSPMRFAISATSDPTGAWHKYAAPGIVLDQPKIEASSDKFVIAGNGGSNNTIYVYDLNEVAAGAASPPVVALTTKKSNIYQAAVQQTATSDAYLVSSFPGHLYLATITGTPAGKDVALTEAAITIKDFPGPAEPAVPGGQIGGNVMDGRAFDAVYEKETSDGKPVIAFSSARECATRTCITRGRIDLSGTKPLLAAYELIGEPGWDYTYGAVGVNAAGTPFEVYSRSSATADPGVAVVGPGYDITLQPPAAGVSTCEEMATPPCNIRWGDYLGTAIDPSEPESVWVTGLYQASDGPFGWATLIAKVSTASFALPTVTTGAASAVTASSATVAGMVNPNGVATKYHIDYGTTTGYENATSEQSAGSGTAAVPVSVPLTGLAPGTTYHYRLVATTATGNAVGADRTFKTVSLKITAVSFTGTTAEPTVTIKGTNLGSLPPANPSTPLNCVAGDTSFDYGTSLLFTDQTGGWTAGQTGDCIGLIVQSYTSTQIVYRFGADYPNFRPVTAGDAYKLKVWSTSKSGKVAYS